MRSMEEFSLADWLVNKPMRDALREWRNNLVLAIYLRIRPACLHNFMESCQHLKGKHLLATIAFEQPWALNWLLRSAARNIDWGSFIVFDNSRNRKASLAISQICAEYQIPYFKLPYYRTRHANRSHALALNWAYHNVLSSLSPASFSFIDHDLIPLGKIPEPPLQENRQAVYGYPLFGKFGHWSLWAGYSSFDFSFVQNKKLNFFYDFSLGLDTGGRNWHTLYSLLDFRALKLPKSEFITIEKFGLKPQVVHVLDESWLHIGSISYNANFVEGEAKFTFFEKLAQQLASDSDWRTLLAKAQSKPDAIIIPSNLKHPKLQYPT